MKLKELKEKLPFFDTYHIAKDGLFTVRKGFFYRMGHTTDDYVRKVMETFPNARIFDKGEVWKSFRGGASVANQSHWYVKFVLQDD